MWQVVNCPHCEMQRGQRCVTPSGATRDGSHMARIVRAHILTRPTKQLDLFIVDVRLGRRRRQQKGSAA